MPLSGLEANQQSSPGTEAGSVNNLLPLQQLDVGTSFIGGGDQGYIACP
jgi:hypothetical protein